MKYKVNKGLTEANTQSKLSAAAATVLELNS